MKTPHPLSILTLAVLLSLICVISCDEEGEVIVKPDEYTRLYEAREDIVLVAIARVFKEKGFGNPFIDKEKKSVETDYLLQNDWRTKCKARVQKISWKETEATLSVLSEKKTSSGWELRRLLKKKEYDAFFDAIELKVYEEMYRTK